LFDVLTLQAIELKSAHFSLPQRGAVDEDREGPKLG